MTQTALCTYQRTLETVHCYSYDMLIRISIAIFHFNFIADIAETIFPSYQLLPQKECLVQADPVCK